jgi:hypothetical protein
LETEDFGILGVKSEKKWLDLFGEFIGFVDIIVVLEKVLEEASKGGIENVLLEEVFDELLGNVTAGKNCMVDTITEFGVIFEEGVSPCRSVSLGVGCVCVPWEGGTPNE